MSDLRSNPGYEVIGGSFDDADERNIPVGISLIDNGDGTFQLRADNYMPFQDQVDQWYYGVSATSPEPLRQLVTERVIPLYELTLKSLKGIAAGASDHQEWYEASPSAEETPPQE